MKQAPGHNTNIMFIEFILACLALFGLYYFWFTSKTNFWTKRGVVQPKECPFFFGNFPPTSPDVVKGKMHMNEALIKMYREYEGLPYMGTYSIGVAMSIFMIRDLDLVQRVLGK